jgi:hypothetical protein
MNREEEPGRVELLPRGKVKERERRRQRKNNKILSNSLNL